MRATACGRFQIFTFMQMETVGAARRVPYGRIGDFVGRRIRFIGRIKEAEEEAIILEASEGKCVKCFLRGTPPPCRYVEVVATVQDDLTIKQGDHDQIIPLGDNIDIELADAATAATFHPQFSHMFEAE